MRLVAVMGQAYPLFGGAQLTVWTLLKRLHGEYGFESALYAPYAVKHSRRADGVTLATYRDADELKQMLRAAQPDVLLAAMEAAPDALRIAAHYSIPALVYLQSFEYYHPSAAERRRWQIDLARNYPSADEVNFLWRAADMLVMNSRYLRACHARKWGKGARVLYPEFETEPLPTAQTPRYITGICGMPYKGADIFLALADAFPQEQFLLVGDVHPGFQTKFERRPNIILHGRDKAQRFLRESKVVLVPSQWPEPFGRIAVEAQGRGIPTLVSYTGGLTEIVGNAPYGIRKFRTVAEWHSKLAALLASAELREGYAAEGRKRAAKFLQGESTRTLARWLKELAARKTPRYDAEPVVVLRGAQATKSAFSMVNGALYEAMAREPSIQMRGADSGDALESALPDVVIDSDFAQNFVSLAPPDEGKWVVIRPWDFGPFPPKWVDKINRECDQLWVHSRWVRAQALAGGVEARRVRVVPLGIDPRVFTPKGRAYPLATKKRFKFLFVGAAVLRKGIDILLDAYGATFTRKDDVCLVIKDHAEDVFYKGIALREEIAKWQADPRAPEIIYLRTYLSAQEMGALYRACTVSVFPYRAEGFGMPILEALACGTPPLVPNFGACLDFCNASNAFLMPVRRIKTPVLGAFAFNTLGFTEELSALDFGEVRAATLTEFLFKAYGFPRAQLAQMAEAGVQQAHAHFTWGDSARHAVKALAALENGTVPYRLRETRRENAARQKRLVAAQALYRAFLKQKV